MAKSLVVFINSTKNVFVISVSIPVKRKWPLLKIRLKSKILPYLDYGVKAAEVAQEYSIGKATVSNIKKAKPMIEKWISQSVI